MKKIIRITESKLNKMIVESVKRILKEEEELHPSYQDWSKFLNNKEPVFEFYNHELDDYDNVYADYNEENGTIQSGYVTNTGFHPDGKVEVSVENGNFDTALNEFYNKLVDIELQKGYELE